MQKNKFDEKAKLVIKYAGEYASSFCSHFVDIEHFLLGILKENSSFSAQLLLDNEITTEKLITYTKFLSSGDAFLSSSTIDISFDASQAIEKALDFAGVFSITTDHLLMGILKEPSEKTKKIFNIFKVNPDNLLREMNNKTKSYNYIANKVDKKKSLDSKTLNQYGKELVSLAESKLLDPVIGREKEIDSLICILSRRRKNNPAIIGEAGVGKTALVEGLAYKIATGDVPLSLQNKKLVSLDLSSVIAGTKYRGEFEERVKHIADECTKHPEVILFIDELHIIMGAGGAEGAIDAANILKPALSRGQIQIIGATTIEEYRKHIEKDSALERRFQKIIINEPSQNETKRIIKGIRSHLEHFHKVHIPDDAINSAVNLSVRYFADRKLPDKAIDLIDEACASFNMQKKSKLAGFRTEIADSISVCDVQNIVAKYTGINSFTLDENTATSVNFLQETLKNSIIGQDDACEKIISAIKRSKVGINDPNRPIGSFIFLGPTGVGKTEICKSLAYGLFRNEKAMIKIDMSEFMDKSSVSKLVGATAGYVGYDDSNAITEKIRNNPYSVVLFDEIEKAHPDVLNLLLQVLEDGIITDSCHRKINFKNAIVIMTSNIGAEKITHANLGFISTDDAKIDAMSELKKVFRPELINRIDEIVVFNRLSFENICKITQSMLNQLTRRVEEFGTNIEFSNAIIEHISKQGYSKIYGARPIRRLITDAIENPLTDKIINEEIIKGDSVFVDFSDKIEFTKVKMEAKI
ncbi:MAG: ATP-dependent Clp protease ATP-binding subunit [Clostridia bacterium]